MLFNSWEFLVLLAVTAVLYYGLPAGRHRKLWQVSLLLVASSAFYAWENPRLLVLLGVSCLFNALAVERILFHKSKEQEDARREGEQGAGRRETRVEEKRLGATVGRLHALFSRFSVLASPRSSKRARLWLAGTVALNLVFLAFFKYAGFLADLLPDPLIPGSWKAWLTDIPLPVGISFYTFQGISMVVDVWRGDISEGTSARLSGRGRDRVASFRDTSFYIAFFPQLVAGPIVKAHEFIDQIDGKTWREIDWRVVRRCLILGYFLKIFVADNLAEQTAALTLGIDTLAGSGPLLLLPLLYGYSLQIFADFAGYSLIAIGLGELFGYKLPPNFNFPYLSTSITAFWRRWHLSLSSWLRDYLYFPLGGNRKGAGRTYFNLFLVMFLGGLWHGAAWKFALWGSLHGMFLALERLLGARRREQGSGENGDARREPEKRLSGPRVGSSSLGPRLLARVSLLKKALAWFCTFHLVTLLWLTFLMPDMTHIRAFFEGVFSGRAFMTGPPLFALGFYGSAVALYHVWGWLREHREHFATKLARSPLEPMMHGLMVFLVVTNPGAPRGFIYFQF